MEKEKAIQIGEKIKMVLNQIKIARLLPDFFYENKPFNFDLSVNNKNMPTFDMSTPKDFTEYINTTLLSSGLIWGMGGYGEKRDFYQASSNFINTEDARDIHLGLDLWVPVETEIFAPLSGTIHSFQDNDKFLD